jgi:putative acetyltransferase
MITITQERPDTPDAVALIEELDAYLIPLYPIENHFGYAVDKLIAQGVAFFVLRVDGVVAGCGGIQMYGTEYGEIKRMYIRPAYRGQGLSKLMMQHLETYARDQGTDVLRLETGNLQTEAIALYERMGFYRIPPFADYPDDGVSLCYERRIVP